MSITMSADAHTQMMNDINEKGREIRKLKEEMRIVVEVAQKGYDRGNADITTLIEENEKLKEDIKEAVDVVRIMSKTEELNLDLQMKQNEKLMEIKRHYDAGHLADCWKLDDDYVITLPNEEDDEDN